ncbi:MAG: hypothetical protein WD988_03910 [Candidatus Curtissbacteria bacterium]
MSWFKRGGSNSNAYEGDIGHNIRLSLSDQAQENFARDRFALSVYIFGLISLLAQSSLILVSWGKLPPQIPLFYSRPWGAEMLSSPLGLWILPGLLLGCAISNFFVISSLRRNRFLVRAVVVFTLMVAFLTIYDTAKIISLLI